MQQALQIMNLKNADFEKFGYFADLQKTPVFSLWLLSKNGDLDHFDYFVHFQYWPRMLAESTSHILKMAGPIRLNLFLQDCYGPKGPQDVIKGHHMWLWATSSPQVLAFYMWTNRHTSIQTDIHFYLLSKK